MVVMPICDATMCGKAFRKSLKRPTPIGKVTEKGKQIRSVPAFTIQALQKNTCVTPPPKCRVFQVAPSEPTKFHNAYLRQELPIYIEFTQSGRRVNWKVPVEKLDLSFYLPIFVTGLSEGTIPFDFLVDQGLKEIFAKCGHRVLPCLPLLIIPLREAMRTKSPRVIINTMRCLQRLCKDCTKVGQALVMYYRHFLPIMNLFLMKGRPKPYTKNDKAQVLVPTEDVIYMIEATLQVLEIYGGPDAFINIKYHIPLYESFVMNEGVDYRRLRKEGD